MYYPILRGRQNELIAIRVLVSNGILENVVPVIEPVKASSTLIKTLTEFAERKHPCLVVVNPSVGLFGRDIQLSFEYKNRYVQLLRDNQDVLIPCVRVTGDLGSCLDRLERDGFDVTQIALLYGSEGREADAGILDNLSTELSCIVDDQFRRYVRRFENKILCSDPFRACERNSDYRNHPDEFFSEDYRYFYEEGYAGFSDYSIVGRGYTEGGFRPRTVAIHIVYMKDDGALYVRHIVSGESALTDTADLYRSALEKAVDWAEDVGLFDNPTSGMANLRESYDSGSFPGLGMVKRWTVMHHLELVDRILGGPR